MPKATSAQLKKINDKFSQVPLKEDQVYVFRTLAADTLPVHRRSWFSDYYIRMTDKMLKKLEKDYQTGVGVLASHDSSRLPFGRTFDAELQVDDVKNEQVNTLYIDHYMVTYVEDAEGNKVPLKTEIGGMTTQDIANHIEVGHTFDTSIGFSIDDPKCSICNHSLSDWENCYHIPGFEYDVDGEMKRCDVMADGGEGIENSLVYAGAVNRATIQRANYSVDSGEGSATLQEGVKQGEKTLYNVTDFKSLPKGAEIFCYLSKGKMEVFTSTSESRDYKKYCEERESMSNAEQTPATVEAGTTEATDTATAESQVEAGAEATETPVEETQVEAGAEAGEQAEAPETVEQAETAAEVEGGGTQADVALAVGTLDEAKFVTTAEFERVTGERDQALARVAELERQVDALSAQAQFAQEFSENLVGQAVKAGIKARGNNFNAERFEKYLRSLSPSEVQEELKAMQAEFASAYEVRLSQKEVDTDNSPTIELTIDEVRQEAARVAMARYKAEGGDLEKLTKQAFEELKAKHLK